MPPTTQPSTGHASLIAHLSDVIWMATEDGQTLLECNEAFETVFGRPTSALAENPQLWLEVVLPDDRAIAEQTLVDLAEHGKARATYRIVRPDGELHPDDPGESSDGRDRLHPRVPRLRSLPHG